MFDAGNLISLLHHIRPTEVVSFVIAWAFLSFLTRGITKCSTWITKRFPEKRMLVLEWVPLLNFVLYFGGTILAVYIIFDVPHELILGVLAALLISLGFALKDMANSIISGILLLLDKPFQVGDHIRFQDKTGEVTSIGLHSTRIFTAEGSTITIPNALLMRHIVTSENRGKLEMMTTINLHLSRMADLIKTKTILEKMIKDNALVDNRKPIILAIKEDIITTGVSVHIAIRCVLKDARTEEAFQTQLMLDINAAFLKHKLQ